MRRTIHLIAMLALVGYSAAVAMGAIAAGAQESDLNDLGLPKLDLTVTATAFEGIPAEIEAGRYAITVTAAADTGFGGGLGFAQPVEGMTSEQFLNASDREALELAFQSTFAGGVFSPAGESSQVVVDLTPGEWIAWGDNPMAAQAPVIFEVTGEMPDDLVEPESSATVTMGEANEYAIEVTEGELTTGPQMVKIENFGAQPHFISVSQGPDNLTDEDVAAVLESEMTGTPPANDLDPNEDFVDVITTGTQSTGTDIWISVDLEPGAYALICFFPDTGDGMPHAFHGMFSVIEVSD